MQMKKAPPIMQFPEVETKHHKTPSIVLEDK